MARAPYGPMLTRRYVLRDGRLCRLVRSLREMIAGDDEGTATLVVTEPVEPGDYDYVTHSRAETLALTGLQSGETVLETGYYAEGDYSAVPEGGVSTGLPLALTVVSDAALVPNGGTVLVPESELGAPVTVSGSAGSDRTLPHPGGASSCWDWTTLSATYDNGAGVVVAMDGADFHGQRQFSNTGQVRPHFNPATGSVLRVEITARQRTTADGSTPSDTFAVTCRPVVGSKRLVAALPLPDEGSRFYLQTAAYDLPAVRADLRWWGARPAAEGPDWTLEGNARALRNWAAWWARDHHAETGEHVGLHRSGAAPASESIVDPDGFASGGDDNRFLAVSGGTTWEEWGGGSCFVGVWDTGDGGAVETTHTAAFEFDAEARSVTRPSARVADYATVLRVPDLALDRMERSKMFKTSVYSGASTAAGLLGTAVTGYYDAYGEGVETTAGVTHYTGGNVVPTRGFCDLVGDGNFDGNRQIIVDYNAIDTMYFQNGPTHCFFSGIFDTAMRSGGRVDFLGCGVLNFISHGTNGAPATRLHHVDCVMGGCIYNHDIYAINVYAERVAFVASSWSHLSLAHGDLVDNVFRDALYQPEWLTSAISRKYLTYFGGFRELDNPDAVAAIGTHYSYADGPEAVELGGTFHGGLFDLRVDGDEVAYMSGIGQGGGWERLVKNAAGEGPVVIAPGARHTGVRGTRGSLGLGALIEVEGATLIGRGMNVLESASNARNVLRDVEIYADVTNNLYAVRAKDQNGTVPYGWTPGDPIVHVTENVRVVGGLSGMFNVQNDSATVEVVHFGSNCDLSGASSPYGFYKTEIESGGLSAFTQYNTGPVEHVRAYWQDTTADFLGTAYNDQLSVAVLRLRRCVDKAGRTSEDSGIVNATGSGTTVAVPTNLMITPIRALPSGQGEFSTDPVADGRFTVTNLTASGGPVSVVSSSVTLGKGPTVTLTFSRDVTGEAVSFEWAAEVRPWEPGVEMPTDEEIDAWNADPPYVRDDAFAQFEWDGAAGFTLDRDATTPKGTPLVFTVAGLPPGVTQAGHRGQILAPDGTTAAGTYALSVTATHPETAEEVAFTVTLTVS